MTHIKGSRGEANRQDVSAQTDKNLPIEVRAFLSVYMDVAKRLVREALYGSIHSSTSEE